MISGEGWVGRDTKKTFETLNHRSMYEIMYDFIDYVVTSYMILWGKGGPGGVARYSILYHMYSTFWFSCRYATDIGFLAGTPSVADPRQGYVCARPTATASYDSRSVGALLP